MKIAIGLASLFLSGCAAMNEPGFSERLEVALRGANQAYGATYQPAQVQYVPVQAVQPQGNAYATGYLRGSSLNGSMRYCNYSNGAVITLASYQVCPNNTM